jgi:hypothetical protein
MAIDIYLRLPNDPNYNPEYLEVEDAISNFVQRVEMILTTVPGEVLGYPDFGVFLDGFLWNPYVTIGTIRNEIVTQIRRWLPNDQLIPFSVEVSFLKGDIYDSILIDIVVDGTPILGLVATPNPDTQIKFTA